MLQNLYVVQDGAAYTVLTDLTREALLSSPSASTALQAAIDALASTGGAVTIGRGMFPLADPIRLASQVDLRGSGRGTRLVVDPANQAGIGLQGQGVSGVVVADLALTAEPEAAVAGI